MFYAPQNIFFNGQLSGNGGTSIVAPEVAGFFAQENAYLLYLGTITGGCHGGGPCAPIGNGDVYLYWFGLNSGYAPHYPFYDIISGCNNNDITKKYNLKYYCAGAGYDMVTGWGSVNMLQLAWAINTFRAGDFGAPVVVFSGPKTNIWYNTDQIVSWSVNDTSANGNPATGVAGFSPAWDSDPGDVFSEPTPGSGNSFYSGPQYPNATNGCLDFTGASCNGGVGQGWHAVHVRAWDNTGVASGDYTYGPIGYDTIPPVTTATLSGILQGGAYISPVQVTLAATDNASGVAATYYEIDGGAQQTYSSPFTVNTLGNHTVGFYSVDMAGNVEASNYISFTITSLPGIAVYDSTLGVPKCTLPFRSCDSGPSLLLGKDTMTGGAEPNQPNTIHSSCADGAAGTFHVDESIDRLVVATTNGLSMSQGSIVKISATVWVADTTQDALDLYYATNANNPTWIYIATLVPRATGAQTLSALSRLRPGQLQAVRASFRKGGTRSSCSTGSYDDHDDLAFAVR